MIKLLLFFLLQGPDPSTQPKLNFPIPQDFISTPHCLQEKTPIFGLTIHGPYSGNISTTPFSYYPVGTTGLNIYLDGMIQAKLLVNPLIKPYPKFIINRASYPAVILSPGFHSLCYEIINQDGSIKKYPAWVFKV